MTASTFSQADQHKRQQRQVERHLEIKLGVCAGIGLPRKRLVLLLHVPCALILEVFTPPCSPPKSGMTPQSLIVMIFNA